MHKCTMITKENCKASADVKQPGYGVTAAFPGYAKSIFNDRSVGLEDSCPKTPLS